jgi:hypothetical protein
MKSPIIVLVSFGTFLRQQQYLLLPDLKLPQNVEPMLWLMSLAYLGPALCFESYLTKNEVDFEAVRTLYQCKWQITQDAANRLMKHMDKLMVTFCPTEESPFSTRVNSLVKHIALEIVGRNKNLKDKHILKAEKEIGDSGKILRRNKLVKNVELLIARPFGFVDQYSRPEQPEGWCPSWMGQLRIQLSEL